MRPIMKKPTRNRRRQMREPKKRNTKTALIEAAERLFAERGLGGVSVRDITRAAGARNESALHYHFGGMDALIREIFERRYHEIEQARILRLAELDSKGTEFDLEALMAATVAPLFEACQDEEGRLYTRFCVQLATDPRLDLVALIQDTGMESATAIRDRVRASLSGLSDETLLTRLRRLFTILIILMADYARQVESGTAPPIEQAIKEASVTLAGFLRADPAATSG